MSLDYLPVITILPALYALATTNVIKPIGPAPPINTLWPGLI